MYIVFELWPLTGKTPSEKRTWWFNDHSILGKNTHCVLRVTRADDCSPGLAERLKSKSSLDLEFPLA